jgi:hypothetical protein
MTSIIKVDTLQKANGATPTAADLGINVAGNVIHTEMFTNAQDQDVQTNSWTQVWTFSYTPKLTNSKLIFSSSLDLRGQRSSNPDARFDYRIYTGGNLQFYRANCGHYDYGNSGAWHKGNFVDNCQYINTNGSAVTWTLNIKRGNSTGVRFNELSGGTNPNSTCVVTEIAG